MIQYRVLSYITAYNDLQALQNCIDAIKSQCYPVQLIYIVDNSSDILLNSDEANNIIVKHFPKNIGISGGLTNVMQWAMDKNYDFLWTFDQDSEPEPDALKKLIYYYDLFKKQNKKIGLLAPLPVDRITGQQWHGLVFDKYRFLEYPHRDDNLRIYYQCDAVITSGSLISFSAIRCSDYPSDDLFIDAVDWEYCIKLRSKGYKIYLVKDAILNHRFGSSKQIKLFGRKKPITVSHYSPLRYYYMCRNHTYIETCLAKKYLPLSILHRFRFLIFVLTKIFLFERNQIGIKTWACLRGTYDGFLGKLGKTWRS